MTMGQGGDADLLKTLSELASHYSDQVVGSKHWRALPGFRSERSAVEQCRWRQGLRSPSLAYIKRLPVSPQPFITKCCREADQAPLGSTLQKPVREVHSLIKTMKHYPSYEARLEADRQAQLYGYGVRKFHCADGTIKWEAYGWERLTELTMHDTSYGLFDEKWEAEQYFNTIING